MTPSRRLTALIAISIFSMLSSEALAEQSLYERNPEQGQVLVSIEPDQLEDDEVVEENEDVLEEDDWRVYLDVYGILPLSTTGDITINGNTAPIDSSLADILATVTGLLQEGLLWSMGDWASWLG